MIEPARPINFNAIPFAVFCIDFDGVFIDCNEYAENLTGYTQSELLGENIELLLPEELKASHVQHREHYQHGSGALSASRFIQLVSKSKERLNCTIKISETNEGYIAYVEERTDLSLNVNEHSSIDAPKVFSGIEQAFWEWDIDQDAMYYSAQAMALLGYKPEAFIGPSSMWEKHIADESLDEIYRQVAQHFSGDISFISITCSIDTKQGEKRWVSVVGKVFEYKNGRPYKMFGSINDVTESQQLIEELKKQNRYLQLAERLSFSGHWRVDLISEELYWSKGVYQIHGVTPENYSPHVQTAIEFYTKEEQEKVKTYLDIAVSEKKGFRYKSSITHASGKILKVESIGEVELDSSGKVVGIFGVFRDITKSEDLFEKLKLLAMVNYTIKVPIFFIDDNDNVVYQDLSPQMSNENAVLFNYINFTINDYLLFKRQAKEQGQLKQSSISFDKYNTVFNLSVTYEPDSGIYIWIVENITEKFRKDQQQIISNRLALLGNTFGNVSHDINNVLGVALGATEMLELKFSQGATDISRYIERVKNAIDKGKDVTERLLAFTRKPTIKVVEFDPVQEIKDNKYLFKQLLLNTIEFSCSFADIHCLIRFPQGEFINILLNLVLNAQDAIKEQQVVGKIDVSVQINSEGRLEIRVKDSGIGIKQENLSKIFDPFYSSKSVNKGNGIGLANVYSTVYKHNGQIQVSGDSDLGGAEFTLLFNCRVLNDSVKPDKPKPSEIGIAGKSVLILDDERSIAEFVALYLDSEGADTKHISTKADLIEILESSKHFDIFITDMILPDISGREAVELVKNRYPSISIYSISGYIAEEKNEWPYPVLRKPFNSKELGEFLKKN